MNFDKIEGWNTSGNHDSKYDFEQICALVGQARDLEGVKDKRDVTKMPEAIRWFVEQCLYGDKTIWITKGIHQRWARINASGVQTQDPDPHIQVKFTPFSNRAGEAVWIALHVRLSEKPTTIMRTSRSGKPYATTQCQWQTVALSAQRYGLVENWPAAFTQSVDGIQEQGAGRRGLKRRNSVGLIVPAEFRTPVPSTTSV